MEGKAFISARHRHRLVGEPETQILLALAGPFMAVNQDNRIALANDAALELLGWNQDLIGRPLTDIIPERLRALHIAGFRRYVLSGVSRLHGRSVRVPALRRDGTEVSIDLRINVYERPNKSRLAIASLQPSEAGAAGQEFTVLEQELAAHQYRKVGDETREATG